LEAPDLVQLRRGAVLVRAEQEERARRADAGDAVRLQPVGDRAGITVVIRGDRRWQRWVIFHRPGAIRMANIGVKKTAKLVL